MIDNIFPRGTLRQKAFSLIWRSIGYLLKNGIRKFVRKAFSKITEYQYVFSNETYTRWWVDYEPTPTQLTSQKNTIFSNSPKISIIVPLWNTPEKYLHEMIKSVQEQTYANWELCMADGGSTKANVNIVAGEYAAKDSRIKFIRLDNNQGIAGNSNATLRLATGDYVAFLDHDDRLPPFSLFEVVKTIDENPDVDFIYSDEDNIGEDGRKRVGYHFNPISVRIHFEAIIIFVIYA